MASSLKLAIVLHSVLALGGILKSQPALTTPSFETPTLAVPAFAAPSPAPTSFVATSTSAGIAGEIKSFFGDEWSKIKGGSSTIAPRSASTGVGPAIKSVWSDALSHITGSSVGPRFAHPTTSLGVIPAIKSAWSDGLNQLTGSAVAPRSAQPSPTTSTTTIIQFNNNGRYNPTIQPLIKPTGTGPVIAQIPSTMSVFTLQAVFRNQSSTNVWYDELTGAPWGQCWIIGADLSLNESSALFQLEHNGQMRLENIGYPSWIDHFDFDTTPPSFVPLRIVFGTYNASTYYSQRFHIESQKINNTQWKYTLKGDGGRSEFAICYFQLFAVDPQWISDYEAGEFANTELAELCVPVELVVTPQY